MLPRPAPRGSIAGGRWPHVSDDRRGSGDPGEGQGLRRRRVDPPRGRGGDERRTYRSGGPAPPLPARQGPRAARHEHAPRDGRGRHDPVSAGARVRADRPRDEWARLVRSHAAGLGPRRRLRRAARALDRAEHCGRPPRVLRDHRGGGGVRRRRDRVDRSARRRRLRPRRGEDARNELQLGRLLLLPGEADGGRARRRARALLRRRRRAGRARRSLPEVHAHLRGRASDRRVRGRARPGVESRGPRGRRDVVHARVVPLRAPHDRRSSTRRAPSRSLACSSARRSRRIRRSSPCSPIRSRSSGPPA
jgi:hypothetical protein